MSRDDRHLLSMRAMQISRARFSTTLTTTVVEVPLQSSIAARRGVCEYVNDYRLPTLPPGAPPMLLCQSSALVYCSPTRQAALPVPQCPRPADTLAVRTLRGLTLLLCERALCQKPAAEAGARKKPRRRAA